MSKETKSASFSPKVPWDWFSKKRHCFSTILTLELKSLLEEEDIKEEKQRRCEGLSGAELLFQAVVVWYYMTRQGVCEQNSKSKWKPLIILSKSRKLISFLKNNTIKYSPKNLKVPWDLDSKKCYLSSRLNEEGGLLSLSIQMLPTFLHFLLAGHSFRRDMRKLHAF